MPLHCPDCGTELLKEDDKSGTFCPNEWGCPAQIEGKIEHFVAVRRWISIWVLRRCICYVPIWV